MARSQIIKDLANSKVDTQTALKRTKVLLQEFDDNKLLEWVNSEIEGYRSIDNLPEYRKIDGQLYGTYFKGSLVNHINYNHVPLPLGKMPENLKKQLLLSNVTEGIEALKSMIEDSMKNGTNRLAKVVPAEYYPRIAQYNDDLGMIIIEATVELNMLQVKNICPKVENKMLDILRYLEKEFGNLDNLDIDLEDKKPEKIKEIVNNIYAILYTDNSISIGNNNRIKGSTIGTQNLNR